MASRRSLAVFLALFLFVAALPPALGSFLGEVEALLGMEDEEDAKEVGLTEEEITHIFDSHDSDEDSKLSKAELIEWVKSEAEGIEDADAQHEASSVLEVYDHDRDGFFSKEEFAETLRAMGADEDEALHEHGEVAEHRGEDKRPDEN
ncbi:unnamed protein product [Polarella glacialis]|uniref:EF-hand domain-containing protein n=1 Tax=Polarella glacialis TaxID=89957 RepID=A0A813F144_POLGL|nr:unnamed protein product [Polarella glacialis]CAE8670850.1 unnamed protein product [Polarella glacialis]